MLESASEDAGVSARNTLSARSIVRTTLLALASLLVAATCTSDGSTAQSTTTRGPNGETLPRAAAAGGEIVIDGKQYPFEATTCSAAPDRFVVAGTGVSPDGESFFVTLQAPDNISLVTGAEAETDDPDPDLPWYRSLEPATLSADGTAVTGTGVVVDSHGRVSREFSASVRATCETNGGDSDANNG